MATVKEKFVELLKGKMAAEDVEAALTAALPSLRFNDNEREYPQQFYEDKVIEIAAAAPKKPKKKSETSDG